MRQPLRKYRTAKTKKNERLEARITPTQKHLIERAAHLRGTSVTDFVVLSAQEAAAETIKNFEMLTLSDEARGSFVKAFLNPPEPTKAAREAARHYKQHMST